MPFDRQAFQIFAFDPDPELAVHDRHRRRDGAMGAHDLFDIARHFEILRIRHPMGNNGGFERHHRPAGGQRIVNFGTDR